MIGLYVVHIYMAPINAYHNMRDERVQHFYVTETFTMAFSSYEISNSHGLLIAGDVYAHAWEWDATSEDDDIGTDMINLMEKSALSW